MLIAHVLVSSFKFQVSSFKSAQNLNLEIRAKLLCPELSFSPDQLEGANLKPET